MDKDNIASFLNSYPAIICHVPRKEISVRVPPKRKEGDTGTPHPRHRVPMIVMVVVTARIVGASWYAVFHQAKFETLG
jgi:hypothetical protein